MRKLHVTVAVILATVTGVALLVTGGLGFRAASAQQVGANESWRRQQDAQAAFHRTAAEVSRKLQVGEIDDAGWHREVEAFSNKFKTDSEAAGNAWVSYTESASWLRFRSINLLAAGLCIVVGGMVAYVISVRTAASSLWSITATSKAESA